MTGDGEGADLFACTNGAVNRYWVTAQAPPSGGVAVAGSSCVHINGKMTMTFSRALTATGNAVAVKPGTCQVVLFARGGAGSASAFSMHAVADRSGKNIDMQDVSKACGAIGKKSAPAVLWMHMFCMVLCFGALLPWGVALANRTRGASPGAWFKLHRAFQSAGWCCQFIGFVMAVWHCDANAGGHFGSNPNEVSHMHSYLGLIVVILTTQQPLNAFFRPHPSPGQAKSTGRWIFEIVHKGVGYIAVVLGVFNCVSGVRLLGELSYDSTVTSVALVILLLGVVPMLGFVLLTCLKQNNPLARMCVRLVGGSMIADQEIGKQDAAVVIGVTKET